MPQHGLIPNNPITEATGVGLQGALQRRNQATNRALAFEFGQRKAQEEGKRQEEAKVKARRLDYLTTVVTTATDLITRDRAETELAQELKLNKDIFGTDELLGVLKTANALAKKDPRAAEKFMTENIQRWGQDPSFKATREEIRAPIRREQRETFRGIPQEEGAVLTPQQERVRAGIAGGVTPSEITTAIRPAIDRDTPLENRIDVIMKANPDISLQEATGVATGTTKVVVDPVSGTRVIVDTLTGTERVIGADGAQGAAPFEQEVAPVPAGQNLWELSGIATGPVSAGLAGVSVLSGIVGGPIAQETAEARQFMRTSTNELVRSLSINPRFPVSEMNRIREEVNITPKALDNPKLLRARMKAVDRSLRIRLRKEQGVSDNLRLSVKARQDARSAVIDIDNYLGILGVPPTVNSQEGFDAVPSGGTFFDTKGTLRRKP